MKVSRVGGAIDGLGNVLTRALGGLCPNAVEVGLGEAAEQGWTLQGVRAYCGRCGETVPGEQAGAHGCAGCGHLKLPWDRIVRIDRYASPVSDWIVAMKFAGAWPWGPWFGQVLGDRVGGEDRGSAGGTVVCEVPMHWRRRVRRGYNQSRLMAGSLARRRGWVYAPLLRRSRYTLTQTSMAYQDRGGNVRGSFAVLPVDLSGWSVWLVDDVKTTGHTLGGCVDVLKRAGAIQVNVAVAAVSGLDSVGSRVA